MANRTARRMGAREEAAKTRPRRSPSGYSTRVRENGFHSTLAAVLAAASMSTSTMA